MYNTFIELRKAGLVHPCIMYNAKAGIKISKRRESETYIKTAFFLRNTKMDNSNVKIVKMTRP